MSFRPLLVVATLLFAVSGMARADAAELSLPYTSETFEAMQADGRPILIDISASWCPTCARQHAVLGEIFDEGLFPDMVVITVDFDSQRQVVREFRTMRQSTLIVYRGDVETGRAIAITSRDDIEALLATAYE